MLSVKDLNVKFRVRGRILTAIRGISLDVYEDESIAIVGESGCGKTVFTKTFAGMLDNNGFIDRGDIIFNDDELIDTVVVVNNIAKKMMAKAGQKLNEYAKLEFGAATYRKILALEREKTERLTLSKEEEEAFEAERKELIFQRAEAYNLKHTLDSVKEKEKIKETSRQIAGYDKKIKALEERKKKTIKAHAEKTRTTNNLGG